jgi:biotin transport system substrate-specific component
MHAVRYGAIADRVVPRGESRTSTLIRDVLLVLTGAGLVSVLAQIAIPWFPVPFTGQTLAVLLVGGMLGALRGALSLAVYFAIGALGAPVFTDQSGGWNVITGATGGYIIGFILAAALVGWLCERGADRRVVPMMGALLLGNVMIYAVGLPWLANWTPPGAEAAFGWSQAYEFGLQPFVLGDLLKLAVVAALLPAGWALLQRTGFGREREKDGPPAGLL